MLQFPFSTALVTGCSSGIGMELARKLALGGVRVAASARRIKELHDLSEEAKERGGEILPVPADLSRPEEAIRVVGASEKALGALDLVIANAGIGKTGRVADLQWEDIRQILLVNSIGAVALVRAALPGMLRRRSGYIAGISSLASYRGFPTSAAYSASKAALSVFLESLRAELRPQGISVTDIHPGYVRTPMTAANRRPMPFLIDAESAARLILRAIVRKKAVYNFPWQMALLLRLVRMLPPGLFDRFTALRR